jgi:hypothetical protein
MSMMKFTLCNKSPEQEKEEEELHTSTTVQTWDPVTSECKQAVKLVQTNNGNTAWQDAIKKEVSQLMMHLNAFTFKPTNYNLGDNNYQKMERLMIFDIM